MIIALCYGLNACQKDKTLSLELTIRDYHSGEPIKSSVILEYTDQTGPAQAENTMVLGTTDDNGYIKIKRYIGKKYNLHLMLGSGENYTHCMANKGSYYKKINSGAKYKYTIELKRVYHYLVYLKNVNCFDETDSAWVAAVQQYTPTYKLVGCADTIPYFGYSQNLSFSNVGPDILFHVKVKRNGVTTEYDQAFVLEKNVITPLTLEY